MAGRPRNDTQYWSPRGSIAQQLFSQPRPNRHEYSYNQPPLGILYPDLPLHPDMLEVFQETPYAALVRPPYRFRPVDSHGWFIVNDSSLLPTFESEGQVTDGEGRYLGQVVGITSPLYRSSSMELGNRSEPSSADSFMTNPPSLSREQPSNLATPGSPSASFASRAETLVAQYSGYPSTEADSHPLPVCDRKFDVGVPLM
jgi:hypothetical protein